MKTMPTAKQILERFPTWNAALKASGMEPPPGEDLSIVKEGALYDVYPITDAGLEFLQASQLAVRAGTSHAHTVQPEQRSAFLAAVHEQKLIVIEEGNSAEDLMRVVTKGEKRGE